MKTAKLALITAACLTLAPLAFAKPNAPDPLSDITPGGCSFQQIAPFGASLLANWTWANGTVQTKFGGDAVFDVVASTGGPSIPLTVEFELEQFEPGTSASDYPGVLVYRCSTPVSDPAGSCNGSVLGIRDAIQAAVEEQVPGASVISASLVGVNVKAMNPGKGGGRQNYELVNVCSVPG